jgi:hypothetical protein
VSGEPQPVVRDLLPVEAAALLDSGIWVAVEGEVLPAGSGMHWPYCNDGRCPGCVPQEIIDDYAPMAEHVQRLLAEGLRDLHEQHDHVMWSWQDDHPVPRQGGKGQHHAAYMTMDEAKAWAWAGYEPIEDEDGAPSGYDLGRLAWMYRYRLTADTLRWSDIRITGLGIS